MEKKKITIEVEPATAVATVGLLRGIFPVSSNNWKGKPQQTAAP